MKRDDAEIKEGKGGVDRGQRKTRERKGQRRRKEDRGTWITMMKRNRQMKEVNAIEKRL